MSDHQNPRQSKRKTIKMTDQNAGHKDVFYSQNTFTFNTLRHRLREKSMSSEGQTDVKHLRLPPKTFKT